MPPFVDLTDRQFGKLTARQVSSRKNAKIFWLCDCECGRQAEVCGASLRTGKTQSCGKCPFAHRYEEGMGGAHYLFKTWMSMRERCNLPSARAYRLYGGRGIKVCAHWNRRGGFTAFLEDVGERPEGTYPSGHPLFTLDRIDNDAHYSCGHCPECVENGWTANCEWVRASEQLGNQRPRIMLSHVTADLIDAVRGDLTRDAWVDQLCLAVLDVTP
jgi:hypothetical protein